LMARLPPKDFLGNKLMVSEVKLDRYDLWFVFMLWTLFAPLR
jgi:hypothetical protein